MFCIHIWIPLEIPSIFNMRTWGKNENLAPPYTKTRSGAFAFGAKCTRDLLNILAV